MRGLALTALLACPTGAQDEPQVHYLQLQEGSEGCLRDLLSADVNGDGRLDLILAIGACPDDDAPPAPGIRRLQVHLRRDGRPTFAARPDRELALAGDVVAFAAGDVDPAPGAELILWTPSLAAAATWDEESRRHRFTRLGAIRFLWQPANPRTAFAWPDAVQDLDGDGRDDLLIPEPGGYRVLLQSAAPETPAAFAAAGFLRMPAQPVNEQLRSQARFTSQRDRLALGIGNGDGDGDGAKAPLLQLEDRLPVAQTIDWEGDGDQDVCALSGNRLLLWRQGPDGFPEEPSATLQLPERRRDFVNPSYSAQLCDLDGDEAADLLVVSSETIDDDVRSLVEVYLGRDAEGPLAGGGGTRAADRLRLQGFVNIPTLDDVDGDGKVDLAIGSLRPDMLGAVTSGGEGAVEAQLNLFRNGFDADSGRFRRPVWLVHRIEVEGIRFDQRGQALARFLHDLDGDGRADLLLRRDPELLQVLRTTERGRRRLQIDDPLWELRVDEEARVRLGRSGSRSLHVLESRQLILVEFP